MTDVKKLLDEAARSAIAQAIEETLGPPADGLSTALRRAIVERAVALMPLPDYEAAVDALAGFVGPCEGPDGFGDEEAMWWNHPEWPDDEQLTGGTVGQYREARAVLRRLRGEVDARPA